MQVRGTLTTAEVAGVADVAPSTIKRWADRGLLPFARTAGGHRRFDRLAVERLLRGEASVESSGHPVAASWVVCLVEGRRHAIEGRLLEARSRLGSWSHVADEVAGALVEMGRQWERGQLTVAQEHVASDALARSLARVGDALPGFPGGPRCILACGGEDEHTLGLSLAELCLREMGWAPLWLGRRTPVAEIVRLATSGEAEMVVLYASVAQGDGRALRAVADEVGSACRERGATLVLGGAGAWPDRPSHGVRLTSFAGLHDHLALMEGRR